ncbi:MAG TPA: hypothetical protein VML75_13870 [Kofleriaceae bacterium]|nr:hypothetical protein [Kofleriaceae bacterium]
MDADPITLLELTRALRARLPVIPSGYEPGLEAMTTEIAAISGQGPHVAEQLVAKLIESGWVRYVAAGRGIGTAAPWTYERLTPEAAPT